MSNSGGCLLSLDDKRSPNAQEVLGVGISTLGSPDNVKQNAAHKMNSSARKPWVAPRSQAHTESEPESYMHDPNRPPRLQHDLRPEANMVLASQQTGLAPAGQYFWRPPSPPHIHVPQAPEDEELVLPSFDCGGYGYTEEDRKILAILTQSRPPRFGVKDWKYEHRRAAQSILSYLYLGPSVAARDIAFLQNEGITMLLVIRDTMSAQARLLSGDKPAAALGIESAAVDVAGSHELIAAFPRATRTINDHLIKVYKSQVENGVQPESAVCGKVMLFCESGNERSAVVLAAYLMATYGLDLVAAIQYVQSQRFCVAFDDGLKNLLCSYQSLLDAQKIVMANSATPPLITYPTNTGNKRRRDEIQDEQDDTDMDRADDEERFGHRSSFAPFHDQK